MTSPSGIPQGQTDGRCIAERGDQVQRKMLAECETPSARTCVCHGSLPCDRAPGLLSFVDQVAVVDRIREIIDSSSYLTTDTDLKFRWGRIRNSLREANIYLSLHSIWMRPYVYPLLANDHYAQTQQRIYMSATVGDPGDLSRRLGVKTITKIPIPPEYAEKTSGRRFVVMNRIEDKDIPPRLAAVILACLRIHPKSVWLCSSEAVARKYRDAVTQWLNDNGLVGHPTWQLTPLGDEIDEFKASPSGHLFVAGRFDGMDFKADECRLVVLTTLPRAINPQEDFLSAHIRDSGFMLRRLNQRIVQALGRCNRSDDDFGVYVLADKRFATHLGRESNKEGLPKNIVAETDMAQDLAGIPVDDLVHRTVDFMRGDYSLYDQEMQDCVSAVPIRVEQSHPPDTSADEVIGWASLFASQNYTIAAGRFEGCWDTARSANLLEITAFYGWQWAKALYLQSLLGEPGTHDRALQVLEEAIQRGGLSTWFNRMRASLNRARHVSVVSAEIARDEYAGHLIQAFDDILEKQGVTGNRFERWCETITTALQSERHAQYQEGLEQLGTVLGYRATRPRYDTATDCRWRGVFGNAREVITFEAKIEQNDAQEIFARDIGQAHNQLMRALSEHEPQGYTVRGTIVTHLMTLAREAEASAGSIKIFTKPATLALWEHVRLILSGYRGNWSLHDIPARRAAAQTIRARLPATGWLIRAVDGDERFITAEGLLAEWP